MNKNKHKKIFNSPKAALEGILFDGMTIMSGGFGLCGLPENLIFAIKKTSHSMLGTAYNYLLGSLF